MQYVIQQNTYTVMGTELSDSYLAINGNHGYDLRATGKLQTLFTDKLQAESILNNYLAIYPNNKYRNTRLRCYGTKRDAYVEGMICRYGNISK